MSINRGHLYALIVERSLFYKEGFVLSSGVTSNVYFDLRRLTLNVIGNDLVAYELLALMKQNDVKQPFVIGGPSIGADFIMPGIMSSAYKFGYYIPDACAVRKEVKKHGMQSKIENQQPPGTRVVVVEDVITSGSSVIDACAALREAKNEIIAIVAILDRQAGGVQTLREQFNCPVETIFKLSEFI